MREPVFLDSGIFIAFLNAHDQRHEQAVALFSIVNPRWSTSYVVISETYSWVLHRHGEESAPSFRRLIDDLEGLRIFDVNQQHHLTFVLTLEPSPYCI